MEQSSKEWYDGKASFLVTTTCGTTAIENKLCTAVVVVGYLYDLSTLLQALGRIREEFLTDHSRFVWLTVQRNPNMNEQFQSLKSQKIARAQASGILTHSEKTKDSVIASFSNTMTMEGLVKLNDAPNATDCIRQRMAAFYGFNITRCRQCSYCDKYRKRTISEKKKEDAAAKKKNKTSAVPDQEEPRPAVLQTLGKSQAQLHNILVQKYEEVAMATNRMFVLCLLCQKPRCSGDCQVGRGECYICYSSAVKHDRKKCAHKSIIQRAIGQNGCQSCFGLFEFCGIVSDMVKTFCPASNRPRYVKLCARQVPDSHPEAPLLPPNEIANEDVQDGLKPGMVKYNNLQDARTMYNAYKMQKHSKFKRRKYCKGSKFSELLGNDYLLLDNVVGDIEVDVETTDATGKKVTVKSLIKIRDILSVPETQDTDLAQSLFDLSTTLIPDKGNCRRNVGDEGEMYALGIRRENETYAPTKKRLAQIGTVSYMVSRWMKRNLPDLFQEIEDAEKAKGNRPSPLKHGPGVTLVCTKNLANAPHVDPHDTSRSVTFWVQDGNAGFWYFIFPNVTVNGKKGLVVKLRNGIVIEWDGRIIRHCTAKPSVSKYTHVFAFFFGSCR